MQNKSSNMGQEEEIDLVALFSKLWGIFRKRIKLFAVFIILGTGLAVTYYNLATPVYKSRMIVSSTVFQGPSFVIILDNLLELIKEGNHEELAAVLNMDVPTVKKIRKLEVYSSKNYAEQEFGDKVTFDDKKNVIRQEEQKDKTEEFVLVAYVIEKEMFQKLEQGIIYYLTNSPYIKSSGEVKKQALNELKANIQRQMNSLDSLQASIALQLNKKNLGTDLFIGEPGSMYREMLELYEADIRTKEAIVASDINIVESFRIYKKPHSPKLIPAVALALVVIFFLFLVTVIILESKRQDAA